MIRKEMVEMMRQNNTVKQALVVATLKWLMLDGKWDEFMKLPSVKRKKHPHYPCLENCPLCYHFKGPDCQGCPLMDKDNFGCELPTSPYKKTVMAIDEGNKKDFMAGRKSMLKRLNRAFQGTSKIKERK